MAKQMKNKVLVYGVVAVFALYVVILTLTPTPINWSYSFSKNDKIPFGNSILFEELGQLFPAEQIKTSHSAIYNFLEDSVDEKQSIIYINDRFNADELDVGKLLDIVEGGSSVFVAAIHFSEVFKDTLGFKVDESMDFNFMGQDSTVLKLVNQKLKTPWGYKYTKGFHKVSFESYDTLRTSVLGINEQAKTNFVRINYGSGNFYINTNPLAFTNYNLLKDNNYEYVFKSLSYLPYSSVIWDEHYKQKALSASPFRYILSQKALRYAWYLLLFGILTYMVFGAKRRQRIIPIVTAPQNTTLTFIETIGRLYFRKQNHLDIAKKKYTYFLEFLRSKYFIQTSEISTELYNEIAEKCDVPHRTVKQLFEIAQKLELVKSISEEDLDQFNKKIEFFYDKCKANKK
ncbi:DUF4350 domain-containing protein [Labilibacter marinus]|uniref:DUF4350 domain-containing protein n=1 Tax=Labilibacter marinus TaxID=1477105 RepID=UPI000832E7F2|nr:DUF4350 domain-containing protein [Labilibacter marinus]